MRNDFSSPRANNDHQTYYTTTNLHAQNNNQRKLFFSRNFLLDFSKFFCKETNLITLTLIKILILLIINLITNILINLVSITSIVVRLLKVTSGKFVFAIFWKKHSFEIVGVHKMLNNHELCRLVTHVCTIKLSICEICTL